MRHLFVTLVALGCAMPASAQSGFGIVDNSFLVEEAFNQEPGVFQNIANVRWIRGEWVGTFTQEWPFPNQTNQLSFTLPFGRVGERTGIGDLAINYRLQVWNEDEGRPAFAPRISVILPSASRESGLGSGTVGWQANLPFSKRRGDWYFHWNTGLTMYPGDEDTFGEDAGALISPAVAGSVIWQASQTLNLMFEVLGESIAGYTSGGDVDHLGRVTIAPGVRYALNFGEKQVVLGLAAPIALNDAGDKLSGFAYLSYELPFK